MLREYKKDYWGFVYLWRDRASSMYCVGSHLGHVRDGYKSSTGHFRAAYRNRPQHFMRRIIYWLPVNDYNLLVDEENRWLSMIKFHELSWTENHNAGTARYYNVKKYAIGGAWNKGLSGVQVYEKKQCEHCSKSVQLGMYTQWHGPMCIHNPYLTDRDLVRRKRTKTVKQAAYVADNVNRIPHEQCSVCGMITSRGNIARWHNAKCKPRRVRPREVAATEIPLSPAMVCEEIAFDGTKKQLTDTWA